MTFGTLIFAYLVSTLAGLSALALYSDMRRKRFEPASSEDRIFRCEECSYVYTDDPDVDRSRCPQCETYNESFRF
jgi:rubrerythrin